MLGQSPFSFLSRYIKQAHISDLVTANEISFVPYYKCAAVIHGGIIPESLAATQIKDSIYIVQISLLSMSSTFHSLHNFISKRYFSGVIDHRTIICAAKLYLYLDSIECPNLEKACREADTTFKTYSNFHDINEFKQIIQECEIARSVEPVIRSTIPLLIPYHECIQFSDRYYYLLLPYDCFWEPGFKLCTWDFIESSGNEDEMRLVEEIDILNYGLLINGEEVKPVLHYSADNVTPDGNVWSESSGNGEILLQPAQPIEKQEYDEGLETDEIYTDKYGIVWHILDNTEDDSLECEMCQASIVIGGSYLMNEGGTVMHMECMSEYE